MHFYTKVYNELDSTLDLPSQTGEAIPRSAGSPLRRVRGPLDVSVTNLVRDGADLFTRANLSLDGWKIQMIIFRNGQQSKTPCFYLQNWRYVCQAGRWRPAWRTIEYLNYVTLPSAGGLQTRLFLPVSLTMMGNEFL